MALKRKHRYIVYKPSEDGTAVEVEKIGAREESFDDFKNSVEKTAARWCVIDLEWEADDGRKVSKVCLIAFAPDNAASNQDKFLVAANKSTLMQKLKPNANRDF